MRTIDADAFTEFLKDAIKQQKYEDTKIDGLLTVADVIEAVISELDGTSLVGFKNAPTIETEPQWIPCSERLPEDSGEYLTFQCSADIKYGWYQVLRYDDGWNCFEGNKKNEVKYVVAWMPLPKPWGGSEKDD